MEEKKIMDKQRLEEIRKEQQKQEEISLTIFNMVSVLMSEDFRQWMDNNWATIENLEEFHQIMDLYINGKSSAYAE